jgi:hypothetical protein
MTFDGNTARQTPDDHLEPEESGIMPAPRQAISRPLAAEPQGEALETGFISEQQLADLLFRRRVRRVGPGVVASGGRQFAIREAVRVVGRADGHSDPYGLSGVVESMSDLVRAGAQLNGHMMLLGSVSYCIERGVVVVARESEPAQYDPFELLSV